MNKPEKVARENLARRAVERDPQLCLAFITEASAGERRAGIARAVDISERGVGLVLASDFPPGTPVIVELILPNTLCLVGRGVVAHNTTISAHRFRVGVAFEAPPVLHDEGKEMPWRT
jgi:hypothetical protein